MELVDFQREASGNIMRELSRVRSTLCKQPTGTGKTVVACEVVRQHVNLGRRVLWIAHRRELIYQASRSIHRYTGINPDIEMAMDRASSVAMFRSSVCVASKDTLNNSRLATYRPDWFDLIVIDEGHHGVARTYTRVYDYFTKAKRLFLTATPQRLDGVGLHNVCDSVAFDMDLGDAIRKGWLIEPKGWAEPVTGLDLSGVKTVGRDFSGADLARTLGDTDGALAEMALKTIDLAQHRRTLVFCASVDQARFAAETINERLGKDAALTVFGTTPKDERDARFAGYARGEFQFLVNVDVTVEGWDDPAQDGKGVQCISIMRPTKSYTRMAQMVGRGTRPLPGTVHHLTTPEERLAAIAASPKPTLRVLDFVGSEGLGRTTTTAELLNGGPLPDGVAALIERKGGNVGLAELEELKEEAAENKRRADREAREAAKKQARVFSQGRYSLEGEERDLLDPNSRPARRQVPRHHHFTPATQKQKDLLLKLDKVTREQADMLTMAQAGEMLDDAFKASVPQLNYLRQLGAAEQILVGLTKQEASALINRLKSERQTAGRR